MKFLKPFLQQDDLSGLCNHRKLLLLPYRLWNSQRRVKVLQKKKN